MGVRSEFEVGRLHVAFFVCSPGGSATAWLSQTLNLYDERVFCSHGLTYLDQSRRERGATSERDLFESMIALESATRGVHGNVHGLYDCKKSYKYLSEAGCRISVLIRSPEDRAISKLRMTWRALHNNKGVLGFRGLFPARWIPALVVLKQMYVHYGVFDAFCATIDRVVDNLKKLMVQDDELVSNMALDLHQRSPVVVERWEETNILHFTYALHLFTDIGHDKASLSMLDLGRFFRMEDVTADFGGFHRILTFLLGDFADDEKIERLFHKSKSISANRRSEEHARGDVLRQMHIADDFVKDMTIHFVNIHNMATFYSTMGYYDKIVLDGNYRG